MKRFFTSYWSIPVVLVVLTGLYGLVIYIFNPRVHEPQPRNICPSNLKQVALGMLMYSQDYDDKLPPAIFGTETVGWVNGLQPYVRTYQIFQCPAEPNSGGDNPHLPGFTDYWMNRNAASVNPDELSSETNQMILLGDGDGGSTESTASYAINLLPPAWRQLGKNPATRHVGGANYAFLDGHVRWIKPDEISESASSRNTSIYTFFIR